MAAECAHLVELSPPRTASPCERDVRISVVSFKYLTLVNLAALRVTFGESVLRHGEDKTPRNRQVAVMKHHLVCGNYEITELPHAHEDVRAFLYIYEII